MTSFFGQFNQVAAILLLSGLALTPATVLAADRFAVVSIANETNANMTISYRWGDGNWQTASLPRGNHHWFAYPYSRADEDRSPDFIASFDADSRSGIAYHEEKRLHGFRAPEENYDLGHKYAFRYNGPSRRYIELYDLNKQ